jgi:hypothetical protein
MVTKCAAVVIPVFLTAPMEFPGLALGIKGSIALTGAFHKKHFHQRSKGQLSDISILPLTS